ncbi:MAG: 16S rRNA (guanine(527)-N(7))-methyltransferase RsmG [Clostridiales bacterium]|nr:16S rRNA (guanine(527)-N(7))-methyltransferase RsmG [Clostridiales bacterium]
MTEIDKTELDASHGRAIFKQFLDENFDDKTLIDEFDKLTALYFKVNSVINISALKTLDDIYIKHYLDSLYPYAHFSGACCDVGCGGGFPCLPLAIATKLHFTGVESVGKKLTLIHSAVSELKLGNIRADYARSEDLVKLGRKYDTVCCRAVADCEKSIKLCAPLVKSGGKLVLYRTQNDDRANQTIEISNNLTLTDTIDYLLPQTDIKRRLYLYTKN